MKKSFLLPMCTTAIFASSTEVENLQKQIDLLQNQLDAVKKELVTIKPKEEKSYTAPSSYKSAFSQSAFLPDISLIVDTSYVSRNIKDSEIGHLEVPGLAHGIYGSHAHNGQTHVPLNAKKGFNLNYAELGFSSSIDSFFDLSAILHFSESGVDIEEAYFTTTSLPYHITVTGGKFLSGFGRLNSQHQHAWDFSDAPLMYRSFFGNHNLNEIGLGVRTILPTPFYSFVGVELLQGDNQSSFGTDAIVAHSHEEHAEEEHGEHEEHDEHEEHEGNTLAQSPSQPNLLLAYVKGSIDIGDTSILSGVSYMDGTSRLNHLGDENPHAFAADTDITNIEFTTKTMFDSYSYLQFQGEWMRRDMQGQLYVPQGEGFSNAAMRKLQDGYYAQLVYAFNKEYKVGVRYDNIYKNDVTINGVNQNKEDNLDAYSVKLDYKPSEFSLFRLQYNKNNALFNEDGNRQNLDEIILEMNFAIGSHPAHQF